MTNNQEPENRRTDIEEGNYNERIGGDYVQGGNKFLNNSFVVSLFGRPGSPKPLSSAKRDRIRQILLKQVGKEVDIRLNTSLHNRVYIALNVEQNPEQIELPWASEIKVGNRPKIKLDNTDIIKVFAQDDIAGRLLILGQPGAGKTTMLIKLTDELVKRAQNNQADPVPVLFTLSDWKKDYQNIKDWLVEQLKSKYGVRKDIGRQWVANQEIIPLLDGLDELAAERQEKCVIQINEFLNPKNWNSPLVICSRIEEYQRYTTLLQLNNSLELSSLSPQQVTQYLQNIGDFQLLSNISHDKDLSELAKTPLLLNVIVLSAEEISIETWQQFNSSEERLSYLFDAYIRIMLKRPYRDKGKQPKAENTQRWLSWLAYRLVKESTTEFLIERMQPNWLENQVKKNIYNLSFWGLIGLVFNGTFLFFSYYFMIKQLIYF
ncbi:MAG: NACHT domain-containing protein, partial [Rhizonema sp. PD38]|nr:NACHT domain-containing protein [Rhizonema sp. PD38]